MPSIPAAVLPRFALYEADESVAGVFRSRQLQAVLRLAPLTMLANMVSGGVVVAIAWDVLARPVMLLWYALLGHLVWKGLSAARRQRRMGWPVVAIPAKVFTSALRHAVALSLVWSLVPLALFGPSDEASRTLLFGVTIAMMSAGSFALATVPLAATAYATILGLSTAVAVALSGAPMAWPLASLTAIYGGVLVRAVWSVAATFGARLSAEAMAERQSQITSLVLRDYEENGTDVLWETDCQGRLVANAGKLLHRLGLQDPPVEPTRFIDVLRQLASPMAQEANADALAAIVRALADGHTFRGVTVAIAQPGGHVRWWSFSGKAVTQASGEPSGFRGVASDTTAAEQAKSRLTWLAHHDPLTGLSNRRRYRGRLETLLAERAGPGAPASGVVCIDLDDFKWVNDTMGHATGDELLKVVAQRLKSVVRGNDMVARLGGDEFAIILNEVESIEDASRVAERLLARLEEPCALSGGMMTARASVGVAVAPYHGGDIDTLLSHADMALYAAKAAGKGKSRMFAAEMADGPRRRLRLAQALRGATGRGELRVVYQPQVDMRRWRVTGFEALVRWWSPELGEVSPAEFIPIAEESGSIKEIGEWVMRQACHAAIGWADDIHISVNLSPVQALSPGMTASVVEALKESGLKASRLEVEITESVFMSEDKTAISQLCDLRRLGVRIALDDFGTGYSSLSYLQRFPFDTLKIDRSFIKEIALHREQRAIVKMIVGLANVLRMRTVAEGVEDGSQLGVLQRYGCEALQGYLVSRPLEAVQVRGFLATWGLMPDQPMATDPGATDLMPIGERALA